MKPSFFTKGYYYLLLIAAMLVDSTVYAQCAGCTITYGSSTGANVTINAGQVVCIGPGATMSGQIFLNGGTLCNSGVISNLRLNGGRGRIDNYGSIRDTETSISFGGNVTVYAYPASQFTVTDAAISMGTCDSLYFNLVGTGSVSFSRDLVISSRKLSITNGGNFSVGGNFNLNNAALGLTNSLGAVFNVSGSVNLMNTAGKTINNAGAMNVYNGFNIGGTGTSATTVQFNNSGYLSIARSLECTLVNSNFYLNNNANVADVGVSIGEDLLLSSTANYVTNNGRISVGRSLTSNGTITNNKGLSCNTNCTLGGTMMNNSYLNVSGEFRNTGAVYLGVSAFIKTNSYYHDNGVISGPSYPGGQAGYANILITGYSRNASTINGYINVNDTSLVCTEANRGLGFDDVINTGVIAGTIAFAKQSIGVGFPPINLCAALIGQYNVFSYTNQAYNVTSDYGVPINVSAQLNQISFALGPFGPYYLPVTSPPPVYVWQPSNQTGQSVNVTPPSSQTFTVTVTYQGCPFTSIVSVNVREIVYSVLSRELNGSFYAPLSNSKLYFKYDEEYRNNTVLNYKIYKPDRTLLTSCTFNSLQSSYGDNRYSINIPSCLPSATSQYYTLEVQNEKKEFFYLKFKY